MTVVDTTSVKRQYYILSHLCLCAWSDVLTR